MLALKSVITGLILTEVGGLYMVRDNLKDALDSVVALSLPVHQKTLFKICRSAELCILCKNRNGECLFLKHVRQDFNNIYIIIKVILSIDVNDHRLRTDNLHFVDFTLMSRPEVHFSFHF